MTNPSPKPCAEWADILTVTHPDDLSPSWRTALEAHLATCAACAVVRADYERLDRYIQRLPTSRPLPAFPPQLLADGTRQRATTHLEQSDGGYTSAPRLVPQKRIGNAARPSGRFKSALTIATLVVIVALFAVLMRNFATGHSSRPSQNGSLSHSYPTTQATTTGQWETAAGLIDQSGLPVLAPGNPNVVYEDLAPQTAPTHIALRRSDDGGVSWHTLPLPMPVPSGVDDSSLAVSPLDASTVFFTLSMPDPNGDTPACHASQALLNGGNALTHLSGARHCSIQFISSDAGQHWSLVQLPVPGAIGAQTFPEFLNASSTDIFRVQGQHLYSALAAGGAAIRGVAIDVDGVRIVSSTNGGKSWQLVDGQLAASGENICDFAPTATGSTLFAITQSDPYCYSDSTSPNYLWRSDDAGATWAQIGQLPAVATDLTVVSSGDAQPVLYLRMPVSAQYQTIQPSTTPPGLAISTDGGKTWRLAPTKGLPQGTQKNYGPLAVLSDGSIVKVFRAPDQTLTICAWKAGDAAWRSIAQQVYSNLAYLLVSSNAGKVTLWMVSLDADGSYNVTRYNQ